MNCFIVKYIIFSSIVSFVAKCDNINHKTNQKSLNSFNLIKINSNLSETEAMDNNDDNKPDLSVYLVTWNIKGEQPKCDLTQLLNIGSSSGSDDKNDNPLADIYVIGLQEVSLRPSNILFTEPWIQSFDKVFKQLNYARVKYIRLVGVLLMVYTKRHDLTKVRSIETQITRTGFGGLWGNKGGVSISLVVDGISICLVNTHLAPHYENLEQRISDYNTIVEDQYFVNTRKPNILSHDYVIWIGDLNFRIDDLTGDQIHDIIKNVAQKHGSDYSELLEKDQLNRVRREGRAFSEFTETVPMFAPTYKFFVNTDDYDYKSRKPAFTDRILYRFIPNAYESQGFTLDFRQLEYKSHPQYKQSDHKPVSSLFHLRTRKSFNRLLGKRSLGSNYYTDGTDTIDSGDRQLYVTFQPITNWRVNNDSIAWYTISPSDENAIGMLSAWDWIGLYKSDFISIEDQLSYVWANPLPSRWSRPPVHQSEGSSSSSDEQTIDESQFEVIREPWFSVQFSDQSLLISDEFRLVYVSQSGDVLGMSDPFFVSPVD